MLDVIAVVEQDGNLRDVDGFRLEIIDVERQHLNQSSIIGDIGFGAMDEKGKPQCVNGKMPLNAIGRFVETEAF